MPPECQIYPAFSSEALPLGTQLVWLLFVSGFLVPWTYHIGIKLNWIRLICAQKSTSVLLSREAQLRLTFSKPVKLLGHWSPYRSETVPRSQGMEFFCPSVAWSWTWPQHYWILVSHVHTTNTGGWDTHWILFSGDGEKSESRASSASGELFWWPLSEKAHSPVCSGLHQSVPNTC